MFGEILDNLRRLTTWKKKEQVEDWLKQINQLDLQKIKAKTFCKWSYGSTPLLMLMPLCHGPHHLPYTPNSPYPLPSWCLVVTLNELKRLRTRFIAMADPHTGRVPLSFLCEQPEMVLNPFLHRLLELLLDPPLPPPAAGRIRNIPP